MELLSFAASLLTIVGLPGLSLSYLFFPDSTLDSVERLFITLVTGVSTSSLIAFLFLRFGYRLESGRFVVITVAFSVLVLAVHALLAKKETSPPATGENRLTDGNNWGAKWAPWVVIGIGLVVAAALLVSNSARPQQSEKPEDASFPLVEFYVDPVYYEAPADDVIPVRVRSYADRSLAGRLTISTDGQNILAEMAVSIEPDSVLDRRISIAQSDLAETSYVDLTLTVEGTGDSTRRLRIWIDRDAG